MSDLTSSVYLAPPSPSSSFDRMYVVKRDGRKESISFDKVTRRYESLANNVEPKLQHVDPIVLAQKVVQGIFPGVFTTVLDELAAETAAYMSTENPEYGILAARIAVSNLQKQAPKTFSEAMTLEYKNKSEKTNAPAALLSDDVYQIIMDNADFLNSAIKPERDFGYDYFGYKTLERSYLVKVAGRIVETPQYMLMRVSVGIHKNDMQSAIETYELLSQLYFTHATPTLFNSGTPHPQMSSCFLLAMKEDSIEGIYDTLKRCALISKSAGGIGLSIHIIRASKSYIRGTNGQSNGLVPMLRVYNDTARYVDQGGGKRKGAFAVYLEPWHADIESFLQLKKNTGKAEERARDLFYALWIPDLFMKRVMTNGDWSLFCPNEAPGLADVYGDEFETLYTRYENTPGLSRKVMKAQDLWFSIIESQIETGTPYMMYKDSCNNKSNQQNLGTIKSSNLCTEIVEYTSPDEVAVCNLASIALPMFVKNGVFDYQKLYEVTRVATKNLNKIIDGNYYPIEEARNSNMRHRPIGLGVQGLADTFLKMRIPWGSEESFQVNRDIFETIYFAAMSASNDLAKVEGVYPSYHANGGCPVSKGILQFDMWGVTPSSRWDWDSLRKSIAQYGVRNSLTTAPMPTASTSQILGNQESFEPFNSNMFTRSVLAGEFTVVNKYLVRDLMELGLWNHEIRTRIIADNGSIQNISEIPADLRALYKTVWEISQKICIQMAADRGAFIDQSQSFNVYMAQPTVQQVTDMHFYGWKRGLKTGMYYLRTKPAADAIKFTVDQTALAQSLQKQHISDSAKRNDDNDNNNNNNQTAENDEDDDEAFVCYKEEGCFRCGS